MCVCIYLSLWVRVVVTTLFSRYLMRRTTLYVCIKREREREREREKER